MPTSADDVFFDQSATYTVTFNTANLIDCRNLTVSAGSVTFTATAAPILSVYGNFDIKASTPFGCGNYLQFRGGGSQTIKTNGNSLSNGVTISFATTLTLLDNLSCGVAYVLDVANGTLNLAGFTATAGRASIGASSTVSFSSGQIAVSSNNTTVLTVLTGAIFTGTPYFNLTYTGATGTRLLNVGVPSSQLNVSGSGTSGIVINTTATDIIAFSGSGFSSINMTSTNVAFAVSSGGATLTGNLTIAAGKTWTSSANTLTFSGASATINTNGVTANSPITVTGALTLNNNLTFVASSATAGRLTVTGGTITLNSFALSCAAFYANGPTVNFGSVNIVLSCTTVSQTVFSGGGGGTYTGTGKFVSSVNVAKTIASNTTCTAPLVVSAGALTITTNSGFGSLDLTGSTGTITNSTIYMNGNLTLGSGTYTGLNVIVAANCTLTTNAKTISSLACTGGTATLADNLTVNGSLGTPIYLIGGALDANNKNVSTPSCVLASGTLSMGSGTWTVTGSAISWNCTSSSVVVTGTAIITMTSAGSKTFAGGGVQTWPTLNQGGTGTLTISGSNGFRNITNSVQPATINFTSGTTTTFTNFSLAGTAGNLITVGATSTSQAFFKKPSSWYVGANSVDGGNNTGLTFLTAGTVNYLSISYINASVVGPGPGNFFAFF